MANPNWGEFLTQTLRRRNKEIAWNILGNRILTYILYNRGQIKKVSGGASILEPLVYGESSGITWFDGADPVGTTFTPRVSAAEYFWSWGSVPITIPFTIQWKNRSKEAVFDILKTRTTIAEKTFRNAMNRKLFNARVNPKEAQGLADFLEKQAVGAQVTTVGGISKATNTWWNNQYRDALGAFNANGLAMMENLFMDCSVGTLHPDIIIGTRAFWQNYHRVIRSTSAQFVQGVPAELADTQFKALDFWGTPVVWDEDCQADTVYFLTTGGNKRKLYGQDNLDMGKTSPEDIGNLRLAVHSEVDFMVTDTKEPINQFMFVNFMLWGGALICNNMSVQGVLDNVDTW